MFNIFKRKKVKIIILKARLNELQAKGYEELSSKELHDLVFDYCLMYLTGDKR